MDNKKKSDEDLLKEIEAGERRLLGGIYDDLYGTPQNASPEDALKNANDALREARELLSRLPEDMPKKKKEAGSEEVRPEEAKEPEKPKEPEEDSSSGIPSSGVYRQSRNRKDNGCPYSCEALQTDRRPFPGAAGGSGPFRSGSRLCGTDCAEDAGKD